MITQKRFDALLPLLNGSAAAEALVSCVAFAAHQLSHGRKEARETLRSAGKQGRGNAATVLNGIRDWPKSGSCITTEEAEKWAETQVREGYETLTLKRMEQAEARKKRAEAKKNGAAKVAPSVPYKLMLGGRELGLTPQEAATAESAVMALRAEAEAAKHAAKAQKAAKRAANAREALKEAA